MRTVMGLATIPLREPFRMGETVNLGIRPEWIELRRDGAALQDAFTGRIEGRTFLGDAVIYWVRVGDCKLLVKSHASDLPATGPVSVVISPDHWVVFPAQSRQE